jgi:endoglycosylceramidase
MKIFVVLVVLIAAAVADPVSLPQLRVQNRQYVDPFGRVIIFHGMNIVNKSPPYLSNSDFISPQLVQTMANDWGLNLVRTGFIWDGYQHTQNLMDMHYLAESIKIVDSFAENGMYSMIDLHQDYYSAYYCGDGAPAWATIPDPNIVAAYPFPIPILGYVSWPRQANGLPDTSQCPPNEVIGEFYLAYELSSALGNFYDNTNGIQDEYIEMLADIARAIKHNPNVIAVEIMNEPFPDLVEDYNTFINATYGDLLLLQPFYDKVSVAVRQQNPTVPLAFEPLQTNGEVLARKMGFQHPPGGLNQSNKDLLSFHVYCDVTASYANDCQLAGPEYADDCARIIAGDPTYCYHLFDEIFDLRSSEAAALNVPLMVTEFGSFTGNETEDASIIEYIIASAEARFIGLGYWDSLWLTKYNASYLIPTIIRPYARAIAGTPLTHTFDNTTKIFTFSYNVDTQIQAPTEIFVPVAIHYPRGYRITASPSNVVTFWYPSTNLVEIIARGNCQRSQTITITIIPQ